MAGAPEVWVPIEIHKADCSSPKWNASPCIIWKCSVKRLCCLHRCQQGCVLAPTLFSLYLAAMLEVAFRSTEEGVYIQTRSNADLFNVSHFKAKNKTERILVQELLFADDSAIVAHTAEGTQALVDRFESAARSFGLKINIKKTECLYQPIKLVVPPPMPSDIKINNEKLVRSKNFVY